MLFRPDWVFICLPDEAGDRYRWFSLDLHRQVVAVPGWPRSTPYLHFHHDEAMGIELDFPKLEDDWIIKWGVDGVAFTNGELELEVSLTQ